MSIFPGYVEITCPFCDEYRHVKEEKLPKLKRRQFNEPTTIVCDHCWRLVKQIIRIHKKCRRVVSAPTGETE